MVNSLEHAKVIEKQLIDWRRDFHLHPELGFEERRTAARVAEELTAMGWRVRPGVGPDDTGRCAADLSGSAAAAVAAATFVPRHVLGGPKFVAPSDKVNIALVGAGGFGTSMLVPQMNKRKDLFFLRGVVSRDAARGGSRTDSSAAL